MNSEQGASCFLCLLYHYIRANQGCLIPVKEHGNIPAGKMVLGYYDEELVYIRPEVFLPFFRAVTDKDSIPVRKVLEKMFAWNYIKVHWILTDKVRYRPQKWLGKTRKRFITFYRRQLENYMQEHDRKEGNNEQSRIC